METHTLLEVNEKVNFVIINVMNYAIKMEV